MLSSADLKKIVAEARPLIEQQIDLTEQVAGLREVVTAAGGDWSQLKALVKAQIQDERDDAGDGKRVRKILDKADYAQGYADMLGLAKMNEKNSFADDDGSNPAFDRWLEEASGRIDPDLLVQLIEGSKTAAGRSVIMAAIDVVKADRAESTPVTHAAGQGEGTAPGSLAGPDEPEQGAVSSGEDQHETLPSAPADLNPEAADRAATTSGPITAADNARKIRPWCLHADDLSKCGGYGKTHCHSCLKAHADAEGLSA